MLDELDAISFEHQITFESRTHPWIILTKKDGIPPTSYVVKLFTKDEVEKKFAVAKEVFANVIAKAFDLSVPNAALVNLNTPEFISTLTSEHSIEVGKRDYRIKFGTEYIEGTFPFNENVLYQFYDQFEDIDNIFAFDNLIYNIDRNTGKPDNIRFKGKSYYLIDHEYSLNITQEIIGKFENSNWIYPYANHVLYTYLLLGKDKSDYFREFENSLLDFEPDILDVYEQQLQNHGYNPPYEDYILLKEYLNLIKLKSKSFITLLKKRVQA